MEFTIGIFHVRSKTVHTRGCGAAGHAHPGLIATLWWDCQCLYLKQWIDLAWILYFKMCLLSEADIPGTKVPLPQQT